MADTKVLEGGAQAVFDAITKTSDTVEKLSTKVEDVLKEVESTKSALAEVTKNRAPAMRVGENPLTDRKFSFARLIKACVAHGRNSGDWKENSKVELAIAEKLKRHFQKSHGEELSDFVAPLSTAFLAQDWSGVTKEIGDQGGLPAEFIKEIQEHFNDRPHVDPAEVAFMKSRGFVLKDNVSYDATLGGSLVPLAAQGEMIETLRNNLVFARAGCRMVALPPQGAIRFPTHASSTTINAYAEGQTITESEIGTGFVSLTAKSYRGLVDFTDELLKFASIPSYEALIREDLARETQLKMDRDMIYGPGGLRILGVVNHGSIVTRTGATPGTDGDTLGVSDPDMLVADMADVNVYTDQGVVYAMRPKLWAALRNRKDSQGRFMFNFRADNGPGNSSLFGRQVLESTNIPKTRVKGSSGATLTLILAFVPSEIMIGQSGLIDFALTNSDASKFQQGIQTIRTTVWGDMALRHPQSVGLIDQLLNA